MRINLVIKYKRGVGDIGCSIRVVKTVGGIKRIPESELRRLLREEVKRVGEIREVTEILNLVTCF